MKNKFGVSVSDITIGKRVDTTDSDNGIIKEIREKEFLPYFIEFSNGYAWQDLRHIKKVY